VRQGDEMMSLDLAEVSQCVLPGNNRNEVELQFPESDAVEANNDQLVSIRFYIPPDPEADPGDRTVKSSAELLQQRIMQMANIRKTTGDVIGMSVRCCICLFPIPFGRIYWRPYAYLLLCRSYPLQSSSTWKREAFSLLVDDILLNYVRNIMLSSRLRGTECALFLTDFENTATTH
jgi:hypothetical protein